LIVSGVSSARWPDGTGTWSYPAVPTPGASNFFVFHRDIVINEIMYHAPALPAQNSSEAWVELFNRGTNTVDLLGWALAGLLGFSFAPGTMLPAGGLPGRELTMSAYMQSTIPASLWLVPSWANSPTTTMRSF
jgi:hypothetical protein